MSATGDASVEFITAAKLREQERAQGGASLAALPAEHQREDELVVAPEVDLETQKKIWNSFFAVKHVVFNDTDCFDLIEGTKELNRTGVTRLALAFGISLEIADISEGRAQLVDAGEFDYRFLVRVRASKGGRVVEGIASCRISEIPAKTKDKGEPGKPDFRPGREVPIGQREHFALTKASTRAMKRAVGDMLGGTELE